MALDLSFQHLVDVAFSMTYSWNCWHAHAIYKGKIKCTSNVIARFTGKSFWLNLNKVSKILIQVIYFLGIGSGAVIDSLLLD